MHSFADANYFFDFYFRLVVVVRFVVVMDPSAETISEWNVAAGAVRLVFEWAGLDPEVAAVVMGVLDLDPGDHYRALAMFTFDEIPFDGLGLSLG